jgi:hypothetical protein
MSWLASMVATVIGRRSFSRDSGGWLSEACGRAGSRSLGFYLAIPRRGSGVQGFQELSGRCRNVIDGAPERDLIGGGRFVHPTELADELERGGPDLIIGGGRFEIEEGFDTAAHESGTPVG